MVKVFVYGSLMNGFWNFEILLGDKVKEIRKGTTRGEIYHLPEGYPGAIEGCGQIHGELIEVDDKTLKELDLLEGYRGESSANLYNRVLREVTLYNGTKKSALCISIVITSMQLIMD
jgi:gamma-glutamylcyclotransferase (GGCT)/AIG2-like uncharacterized protein YtfP